MTKKIIPLYHRVKGKTVPWKDVRQHKESIIVHRIKILKNDGKVSGTSITYIQDMMEEIRNHEIEEHKAINKILYREEPSDEPSDKPENYESNSESGRESELGSNSE